jgi:hypothetical protein
LYGLLHCYRLAASGAAADHDYSSKHGERSQRAHGLVFDRSVFVVYSRFLRRIV